MLGFRTSRWLGQRLAVFARDKGGNVAIMFGLAAIPFFTMAGMAIDFSRAIQIKAELSAALDATALALGTEVDLTAANAKAKADKYFKANFHSDATPSVLNVSYTPGTVQISASATFDTVIVGLIGFDTMDVDSFVEVKRASKNLEVAMVLDVTGSMKGSKITDLKAAAKDLIDIVVQDTQTPYFSKVALIPYSMGVNVGTLATNVRGSVSRAASRTITAATKASPVVITSAGHGYQNGEIVYIANVSGMTQLNGNFYTVASATTNTFALSGVNGSSYSKYTSGGTASCGSPGCTQMKLTTEDNVVRTFVPSTCVTERTGTSKYTDASPATALVGPNYVLATSSCLTPQIRQMTSDKAALKDAIDDYAAVGSTAGQVGIAWGWYMLAPNFGSLFTGDGVPKPYGTKNLLKIAVIMTDGAFNTIYSNGVIAQDSTTGSGGNDSHINKNGTNGDPFTQSKSLCTAMKAAGVTVYTVGFDLDGDTAAQDVMAKCATSSGHAKLASSGTELRNAFREIAIDISNLRVSR